MNRADWHAHWEPKPPTRPNPSKDEERGLDDGPWDSLGWLMLSAVVLVITCAAIYSLVVGLG